jgi:hypothetical protein
MSSSIIPVMLWAQDKTHLFVTVQIVDAKDTKIDLTENKFSFAGSSGNKTYALDFEFADAIVPDESKTKTWGNRVEFFIAKKDKDADEYWEHVLKVRTHAPPRVGVSVGVSVCVSSVYSSLLLCALC